MKITIVNFKKFNPRSDLKSMPWLRLQNNFFDEEDFFDEDVNTTWLFIFLLCQCAQKVNQTLELREKYLISKSKLTKKQFHDALNRLKDKGLILLEANESDRISTDSCLTNERTNITNSTDTIVPIFDIDSIYSEYPKKVGKAAGMKKLQSVIKSQAIYEKVMQGVINYKNFCLEENTEQKYIKQFSTFVNGSHWEDEYISQSNISDIKTKELQDSVDAILNRGFGE